MLVILGGIWKFMDIFVVLLLECGIVVIIVGKRRKEVVCVLLVVVFGGLGWLDL